MKGTQFTILILYAMFSALYTAAQNKTWTFEDCTNYALEHNIDIQQSALYLEQSDLNYKQYKANRLPAVDASVSHSLAWSKDYNSVTEEYGNVFENSSSTSYNIGASVTIFNGFKLNNQIEQAKIDAQSQNFYSKEIEESVELSMLEAYLNILYAQEDFQNAQEQVEIAMKELELGKEKLELGLIPESDYLLLKSELASEKNTKANARTSVSIAKLELMQLLELPLTDDFAIAVPEIESLVDTSVVFNSEDVYKEAINIKPAVKESELSVQSEEISIKIAKADYYPNLNLSAGIGTGWENNFGIYSYSSQLSNKFSPSVSVQLTIPVFQKNQVKTNVKLAEINVDNAKLEVTRTKNEIRKNIEQAIVNVITGQENYKAALENWEATKESYEVASEKFELGMLYSLDLMTIKNELITAESNTLQAKYQLIYSLKLVDFYRGNPISFD